MSFRKCIVPVNTGTVQSFQEFYIQFKIHFTENVKKLKIVLFLTIHFIKWKMSRKNLAINHCFMTFADFP